jgi:hypothetical protein
VFTYSVGQRPAGDSRLVLTITDDAGKQIRRLDLSKDTGVHRIAWDLHGQAPNASGGGRGGRGGTTSDSPDAPAGGRGRQSGPPATPGRYRATIGKMSGDTVTPIGQPQSFVLVPLQN